MALDRREQWLRAGALTAAIGMVLLATVTVSEFISLSELSDWMAPHRDAWYALPGVMAAFVGLGVAQVPVLLLITVTGLVFGPWLGPLYAMAGCLASASTGFALGRWIGRRRVERLGGDRVRRLTAVLERNGTFAVFLLRKVPAPFLLANVVAGAAPIRYRDFLAGTLLGMGAIVVALAGFGYQLPKLLEQPTPSTLIAAALIVGIPLTIAWIVNRGLRQARYGT